MIYSVPARDVSTRPVRDPRLSLKRKRSSQPPHYDKRGGTSYVTVVRGHAEGSGGSEGRIVPLTEIDGGEVGWGTRYSVPISVGDSGLQMDVQVDTGSSDLWVTSNSCSSSACSQTKTKYNPSQSSVSTASNVQFNIPYLRGNVSGSIYWDRISLGRTEDDKDGAEYQIDGQAFAAAQSVDNEPISDAFEGVMGLALPLNSIISQSIPPTETDAPDGAAITSNLFSLSGGSGPPSQHFISLALSRPGTSKYPGLLGLGRHPTQLPGYEDNSADVKKKVVYTSVQSTSSGTYFWKSTLRKLTVWVDGNSNDVSLPQPSVHTPGMSSPYLSVVHDSGVPLILTSKTIADSIYGTIGVAPSSDGQYYVPCNTPLNISVSLDGRDPIWIHPLDMTAINSQDSSTCIGLLQSFVASTGSSSDTDAQRTIGADIIFGTPFLRNVYMVMGYQEVNSEGTFGSTSTSSALASTATSDTITPRLGFLPLTIPTNASEEFHKVRVEKKALDDNNGVGGGSGSGSGDGKKLSIGVKVLIGLLAFFAVCVSLFGIRWLILWRKSRQRGGTRDGPEGGESYGLTDTKGYVLANRRSSSGDRRKDGLSEDELRTIRYEAHLAKRAREASEGTLLNEDANGTDQLPTLPMAGMGMYGGQKDYESASSASSEEGGDERMALNRTIIPEEVEEGVKSDEEDERNEAKSVLTSAVGSAGHPSPVLNTADLPPLPSPMSPLALPNTSHPPSPLTINTDQPPAPGIAVPIIPKGAAQPHTFAKGRPLSFSSLLTPGGAPSFLSTDTAEGAKKFLPSLAPNSPLMTGSEIDHLGATTTENGGSTPTSHTVALPAVSSSPAQPSSFTSSSKSLQPQRLGVPSTQPANPFIPPPLPPSLSIMTPETGKPPRDVQTEFGVLSRASSTSTTAEPGIAGIGSAGTRGSFGLPLAKLSSVPVVEDHHKRGPSLETLHVSEESSSSQGTMATGESPPNSGSGSGSGSGTGRGTSMYTGPYSPTSTTGHFSMLSGKAPTLVSVGGSHGGVLPTSSSHETRPPPERVLVQLNPSSNPLSPTNSASPNSASPQEVQASSASASLPRARPQRPTGPRMNSTGSFGSWNGREGSLP